MAMMKRTLPLALLVVLALSGSTAPPQANAGVSRGAAVQADSRGGRYVLTGQLTDQAPQPGLASSGGNYRLLSPANAAADASGCCCKAFLPCLRR